MFVVIVLIEHVLAGRLSPASHMISEYANAGDGWLMVVGFLAWALALALTAATARLDLTTSPHRLACQSLVWLLLVAAAGILITACFATQTSAGVLPRGVRLSTAGRLHDIGSGLATLALLGAAVASTLPIKHPAAFRRWVWLALLFGVGSDLGLLLIGHAVGGARQRLLIAIACGWQALLLAPREGEPGAPAGQLDQEAATE